MIHAFVLILSVDVSRILAGVRWPYRPNAPQNKKDPHVGTNYGFSNMIDGHSTLLEHSQGRIASWGGLSRLDSFCVLHSTSLHLKLRLRRWPWSLHAAGLWGGFEALPRRILPA
ncbi:hypothetical protein DFP73DRAFT_548993 [Morchella snyderi]|nr:hypothetical protein DFP73DRAFT_548993 [Morchella snyderi]